MHTFHKGARPVVKNHHDRKRVKMSVLEFLRRSFSNPFVLVGKVFTDDDTYAAKAVVR